MKTTVDLPDALVREVQAAARERNRTFRSLLEEGLRMVLAQHRIAEVFELPDLSVPGEGLQVEYANASWDELRDTAYGALH